MGQRMEGGWPPLAGCGVVALGPRVKAPPSPTPLRALHDETGGGASWLARALSGHRITCKGLVCAVPSGDAEWLAIGEAAVQPCPGCGGDHHWPLGVVVVHAPHAPRPGRPFVAATVQGVLDARPEAGAPAGVPGRVALRDVTLELG